MRAHFLIGSFTPSHSLRQEISALLSKHSYQVHTDTDLGAFFQWVQHNQHRIDCLVLEFSPQLLERLEQLKDADILLPVLLIELAIAETAGQTTVSQVSSACQNSAIGYHAKVICVSQTDLAQLNNYIKQAINQFLALPHHSPIDRESSKSQPSQAHFSLSLQQQRLAEKLRERLGYLGVYYKRDPQNFVRNLDQPQRAALFERLRKEYRLLVLSYFRDDTGLNEKIDSLVNSFFFADISVSKLVEIHMELMENFAKQLKLEGRSEEILLDYRLTLIDVIAHLCEMYRRSIPREHLD